MIWRAPQPNELKLFSKPLVRFSNSPDVPTHHQEQRWISSSKKEFRYTAWIDCTRTIHRVESFIGFRLKTTETRLDRGMNLEQ